MTSMERQSLGYRAPKAIAEYLREIEDEEAAERFDGAAASGQSLGGFFGEDVWAHTGMLLGYIDPEAAASGRVEIQNALSLAPDVELRGKQVKIALERFWVQNFPGMGKHTILCEFMGKNQLPGDAEEVRYALTTEAKDRSAAPVNGLPIFLGVSVGQNGISFEGRTINVRSSSDDVVLDALGSGTFRDGLTLLTQAQPALKPFVGLAGSLVNAVLSRSRNRQVFYFRLGLDFAGGNTSARLRHGAYVILQGGETGWSWDRVAWDADAQQIVRKTDGMPIEYNWMIVRVSPYD